MSPLPKPGAIVCVTPWVSNAPGPALAIGRMLVDGGDIQRGRVKTGKAVAILHIYKDFLWSMGSKAEPPENPQYTVTPRKEEVASGSDQALKEEPSEISRSRSGSQFSVHPPCSDNPASLVITDGEEEASQQTFTAEGSRIIVCLDYANVYLRGFGFPP